MDDQAIAEDLASDSAYRDYRDLLYGTYLSAIMRGATKTGAKAKPKKGGGGKRKKKAQPESDFGTADEPPVEEPPADDQVSDFGASTLSPSERAAFQSAQDEIKWTGKIDGSSSGHDHLQGGAKDTMTGAADSTEPEHDFGSVTAGDTSDDFVGTAPALVEGASSEASKKSRSEPKPIQEPVPAPMPDSDFGEPPQIEEDFGPISQ